MVRVVHVLVGDDAELVAGPLLRGTLVCGHHGLAGNYFGIAVVGFIRRFVDEATRILV